VIDPALAAALDRLRAASAAAGVDGRWCVIAGAALVIHGLEDGPPRDVDVLADADAATALIAALGGQSAPPAPHPRWRSSVFARIDGAPVIEIMGGFEVLGAGGWVGMHPVDATTIAGAPVATLQALADLYALLDRPGDAARRAAIDHRIRSQR
jgi:hypothetical protein